LPESLKIGERGENLQKFFCRTHQILLGSLDEEKKVKYSEIFLQNTFLISQGRLCENIFVQNTSGFSRREIP